ncbi:hypothetical protein OG194_01765 [Streptomyces sp. NBC_01288]|uniref:hypothetical protein n=1 Tax=Streptomyces sp. NBC_01288 TaxID=2903814 RepID=UPI002E121F4B|nr:hypothetical protein OG194_01765 [Streptomyces sp. NBC_01288]
MSVVTGVDLSDGTLPRNPATADAPELLWDVRLLTEDQVGMVGDTVRAVPPD